MPESLFRSQAVLAQHTSSSSAALLQPSIRIRTFCLITLCLIIGGSAMLHYGQYTRATKAVGWLVADERSIAVTSPRHGGVVSKLLVENGSIVSENQPLIELNFESQLTDGQFSESSQLALLFKRQSAALQSLVSAREFRSTQQHQSKNQLSNLVVEQRYLQKLLTTIQHQQHIASSQLSRTKALYRRGYANLDILNTLQAKLAQLTAQETNTEIEMVQLAGRINTLTVQSNQQKYQADEQVSAISAQLNVIQEQLLKLRAASKTIIYASKDGVVKNMDIRVGQRVSQDQFLLNLDSEDTSLEAKILVPLKDAPLLKLGQQISLRYHAYPYQKFGTFKAEIIALSNRIVHPQKATNAPLPLLEPSYAIIAKLDEVPNQTTTPPSIQHGMTFDADIILGRTSFYDVLLAPLKNIRERI